jgi:hypothetical protein
MVFRTALIGALLLSMTKSIYFLNDYHLAFKKYEQNGRAPLSCILPILPTDILQYKLLALVFGTTKRTVDPQFAPLLIIKGTPYEQFSDELVFYTNVPDFMLKLTEIDRLAKVCEKMARAPIASFIGRVIGGVVSPINLFLGYLIMTFILFPLFNFFLIVYSQRD